MLHVVSASHLYRKPVVDNLEMFLSHIPASNGNICEWSNASQIVNTAFYPVRNLLPSALRSFDARSTLFEIPRGEQDQAEQIFRGIERFKVLEEFSTVLPKLQAVESTCEARCLANTCCLSSYKRRHLGTSIL